MPYTGLADGWLMFLFLLAVVGFAGVATRSILANDFRSRLAFAAAGLQRRLWRAPKAKTPRDSAVIRRLIQESIERDVWLDRDALGHVAEAAGGDEAAAAVILGHVVAIAREQIAPGAETDTVTGEQVRAIIARAREEEP